MVETSPPPRRVLRRTRLVLRVLTWLLVTAVALIAGGLWLLQQPSSRAWLEERVNQRIPGEVTFDSVGLSWQAAIRLARARYHNRFGESELDIESRSLDLTDVLFGQPEAVLRDGIVTWAGESVLSVSNAVVQTPASGGDQPFHFMIDRARVDIRPFWAGERVNSSTSEQAVTAPPMMIDVGDASIVTPWPVPAYAWSGSIRMLDDLHALNAVIHLATPVASSQNRLSFGIAANPVDAALTSIQMRASAFPVNLVTPVTLEAVWNGVLEVTPAVFGFRTEGKWRASDLIFASSGGLMVDAPESIASASLDISNRFEPIAVTAAVEHQPVRLFVPSLGDVSAPTGTASLSALRLDTPTPSIDARWNLHSLGEVSTHLARWPIEATTPVELKTALPVQPVKGLQQFLPLQWSSYLDGMDGRLGLNGSLTLLNGALDRFDLQASWLDGAYTVGDLVISNATLRGPVRGAGSSLTASLQGVAVLEWPLSPTRPLRIPLPPLSLAYNLNWKSGSFNVSSSTLAFKFLDDFHAEASQNGWRLTGSIDLEKHLKPLIAMLAPETEREIEGTGVVQVEIKGNPNEIVLNARCPDLMVYSFDRDPAMGAQMRGVTLKWTWTAEKAGWSSDALLRATHPYVSYNGVDAEWPGRPLLVELKQPRSSFDDFSLIVQPPGGGVGGLDYHANRNGRLFIENWDVKSWVALLIDRFILSRSGEEPSLYELTGKLNGEFVLEPPLASPSLTGKLTLSRSDFTWPYQPEFRTHDMTVSAPVSWPLRFDRLQGEQILFRAASLSIENASYQNVESMLPITPDAIQLSGGASAPMFGGVAHLDDLRVTGWQSASPRVEGIARFEGFDLARLHSLYPFLPDRGTVDGELNSLALSGDVLTASGAMRASVFGGTITLDDFQTIREPGRQAIWKMDASFSKLDLERLTDYFDYGKMTGRIGGEIKRFELTLPPVGSNDWPYPNSFDIRVWDDMQGTGMINRETLEKIVDLGESDAFTRLVADRENYVYMNLGLRAELADNKMKLYGTLKDNMFLHADEVAAAVRRIFVPSEWFTNTINIHLANPEDEIPFDRVWQRLQSQIKGE
ncbi:MAG: hypothetical protein GC154_10935 [bacterium]|nr:hypothetical protein [bacterium]